MAADFASLYQRIVPTRTHFYLILYAVLYLAFVIVGFVPADDGNPVSDSVPYHPFGLEGSLVKLLFAFFLLGFFTAWKSRLAAGVLLILWWLGMCGLAALMISLGKTGTVAMPLPVLVIGVVFLVSGYRERHRRSVA